ncbi:LysR family transcriptional regulator [Polyangium sp. 15x6]|uniref:LysR family transcriptional regulator n=1 Tax=Polyangium sp. 15x6 TaxID=3042687 RepID=UPI00249ABEBE|nr:LysR family transcriptional regulator [Polyangium sp. 15x6]MDI3286074.1 LysR family transcriptional regulator [Polyangium sp. 15x6]
MSAPPVPRLRAVDLNLLTVLDALLVERSVTRAADRLGMTQPAVSNALTRLRLLFDDELFVRHGKAMAPTPRALSLAGPIRKALELIQASLAHADAFDCTANRTFTLGLQDIGEAILLPRFLQRLEQLGAGIRLDIRREPGAALHDEMRLGKVELVLDYVVISGEEFRRKRVLDLTMVPLVRRDHPVVGESLTLDEFLGLEHLILEPREGQTNPSEQALAVLGRSRHVRMQVPHFLSMPLLVSRSNLVCTMPLPLARLCEQHFPVRAVSCPLPVGPIPFFMMWHAHQDADPAHQWLRQTIVELCGLI